MMPTAVTSPRERKINMELKIQVVVNGHTYLLTEKDYGMIVKAMTEKAMEDKSFRNHFNGFLSAMFNELGFDAIMNSYQ